MDNKKEFLAKLKNLLAEYNASIDFECDDCSDLYGIYDPHICISIGKKDIKNIEGWGVDATSL